MSDPCECIFNYESMMRQLLSVLSDSQTECTDTDCLSSSILPIENGRGNIMLIAMIWCLLAMVMFFFRPSSMRNNSRESSTEGKPTLLSSNNGNNEPPGPDVN